MADKDKPKNGRRTIKGTRATPPSPRHKTTGKKDPGGFVSPGFKSEGFRAGKRKTETGPPPSVRARDEKRAKQPPPVKYGGKKKPPRSTYKPSPFPGQPPRPRPKPRPTPKPGPRKPGSAKPRPGPRKPSKGRPKKPMGRAK